METYGIPILEKYSLMLKTLPYFSYTHNACLLLSCFSQKSRRNLKDNYKAFLNCMEKNLMQVEINDENIKRRYSLPCDLFKFKIWIRNEEQATYFKKWIVNISEGHRFYFESNSFHLISLTELTICENLIEGFIPYIETMKSILIHNSGSDQSLLDIACVSSKNFSFKLQNIGKFISNYANISNLITKFFNKINYVELDGRNYSKQIECLEAMKKVPLHFKNIKISSNNAEELENLTDPNLHNTSINNLQLELKSFNISAKTIENLKAIYPNLITIDYYLFYTNEDTNQALFENFTKLLSKLDQTSLEMDICNKNYRIKLELKDVIFKVVESNEECSYIRAKSIMTNCEDEEFCWIKKEDLNMSVLDSYYLYLNKPRHIKISEFVRIEDQEEIKEVEKMFNNESLSEINKAIIIPMKYSHKIYIRSNLFYYVDEEEYQKAIEVIPHIRNIQYECKFISDYDIVSEYLPLFPPRTKYFLDMSFLNLKTDPDLDEKLRMLNWNDKRINSIECMDLSDDNYSFVVLLLGTQKVQECLDSISLETQNLSSCLKIIELLSKCSSIDSIELFYKISDVDNEEKAIRESVHKLIKQVGLIEIIKITKVKQYSDENLNEEQS